MPARPLSIFYGYPDQLIARWCGVSVATARLYKSGARKPSRQALRLFALYRDGRVLDDHGRDSPSGAINWSTQMAANSIPDSCAHIG